MASEIRVDKINSLSGVGTVTLSPTGVDIFHMNSINPTSQIENVTRNNITDSTTIRGHATYATD